MLCLSPIMNTSAHASGYVQCDIWGGYIVYLYVYVEIALCTCSLYMWQVITPLARNMRFDIHQGTFQSSGRCSSFGRVRFPLNTCWGLKNWDLGCRTAEHVFLEQPWKNTVLWSNLLHTVGVHDTSVVPREAALCTKHTHTYSGSHIVPTKNEWRWRSCSTTTPAADMMCGQNVILINTANSFPLFVHSCCHHLDKPGCVFSCLFFLHECFHMGQRWWGCGVVGSEKAYGDVWVGL